MKILHVITGFERGGAEHLLLYSCQVAPKGNEFVFVYLKGEPVLLDEFQKTGKVYFVRMGLAGAGRLRGILEQERPDVLHTHLFHADVFAHLATAGIPVKRFCTMHNIWFKKNWLDYLAFMIYRLMFRLLKVDVVAISESVRRHLLDTLHMNPRKAHLVYNAIPDDPWADLGKEDAKRALSWNEKRLAVTFIGRLAKQKDLPTFLRAISLATNLRADFRIVGSGSELGALRDQAMKLGIQERVIFLPSVDNVLVAKMLRASDVFVLPSIFEGFGITIIEAFRAKTAVIATNIEGPRELIANNQNGKLFQPGDFKALARLINDLVDDSSSRESLGQAGYSTYSGRFTIGNYSKALMDLYAGD